MAAFPSYAARKFGSRDFLKVLLCGLLLLPVQGALGAIIGRPGYGPEWMIVLTVYVALRSELWVTVLAALALGAGRDALSGFMTGLWPLTLIMLSWLFHPSRFRLDFFHPLALISLIFMLTLGSYILILTPIMAILGWPGNQYNPVPFFLVSSLTTALTAPPVFALLNLMTVAKAPG